MTRQVLSLIVIVGASLVVAQSASAGEFKVGKQGGGFVKDRCWQPPWKPCPPTWNPCPPKWQPCPPKWEPCPPPTCPPQWGTYPPPYPTPGPYPQPHPGPFPVNQGVSSQNVSYSGPAAGSGSSGFIRGSQRNSAGVAASSLFN